MSTVVHFSSKFHLFGLADSTVVHLRTVSHTCTIFRHTHAHLCTIIHPHNWVHTDQWCMTLTYSTHTRAFMLCLFYRQTACPSSQGKNTKNIIWRGGSFSYMMCMEDRAKENGQIFIYISEKQVIADSRVQISLSSSGTSLKTATKHSSGQTLRELSQCWIRISASDQFNMLLDESMFL